MNQDEMPTNTTDLSDLAVAIPEQSAIKGGPKKIFIGGLSFSENATTLPDLEPAGESTGGAKGSSAVVSLGKLGRVE